MKASAAQVRSQIDALNPAVRLYLFHGPDESLAAELAQRIARALGPDAERTDIEPRALRESPGLLADEAAALSLFGSRRLIRVAAIDDAASEACSLLLAAPAAGNPVVALGPSLKASGRLVKLANAAPGAICFACHPPDARELGQVAAALAREQGLRLDGDVAQRLVTAAGGDRSVMAREIEKLALYLDAAPERPRDADAAALAAIGADIDEPELFHAIEAIIDGRVAELGGELANLEAGGVIGVPLLRQLGKRLATLAEMRAEIDAGAGFDQVVERIFFRERASTARALRRWHAAQLVRAFERVREAERALMSSASAGDVLSAATCLALARWAQRVG